MVRMSTVGSSSVMVMSTTAVFFFDGAFIDCNACDVARIIVKIVFDRIGFNANVADDVIVDVIVLVLAVVDVAIDCVVVDESFRGDFAVGGSEDCLEEVTHFLNGVEG
ncbi:hypothetical protein NDU88_001388 [Pleurodeles waltl]|uniref:Uncharacterized protein n=1 Tax=Pleurodeles waltl TaxID=8319 RepID=A0AAV7S9Z6_PLEWA|nr:hypothetical protein NDU88_001388 [Pleurodeles waltl]